MIRQKWCIIQLSRKSLYDNIEEITKLLTEEYDYKVDMALADIMSALSKGELNEILYAGHEEEYWENKANQCMEIFADLCSMEISQSRSKELIKKFFPDLLKSFERMV